jgi:hypothetical protein
VDTGLDQNEAELGVLVLAVALEVLADSDGLESERLAGSSGNWKNIKKRTVGLPS